MRRFIIPLLAAAAVAAVPSSAVASSTAADDDCVDQLVAGVQYFAKTGDPSRIHCWV